jgi:quercetin dioxygenase-like cupin family protein
MPIIKPLDMKYVSKPWGWELHICNGDQYCGKKLFIKQGHWLSYHHHDIKDEVLYVESGRCYFSNDETGIILSPELTVGYAFHVKPTVKHQIHAIEDTMIIEFSTHHEDSDSYRTTRDLVCDHEIDGK